MLQVYFGGQWQWVDHKDLATLIWRGDVDTRTPARRRQDAPAAPLVELVDGRTIDEIIVFLRERLQRLDSSQANDLALLQQHAERLLRWPWPYGGDYLRRILTCVAALLSDLIGDLHLAIARYSDFLLASGGPDIPAALQSLMRHNRAIAGIRAGLAVFVPDLVDVALREGRSVAFANLHTLLRAGRNRPWLRLLAARIAEVARSIPPDVTQRYGLPPLPAEPAAKLPDTTPSGKPPDETDPLSPQDAELIKAIYRVAGEQSRSLFFDIEQQLTAAASWGAMGPLPPALFRFRILSESDVPAAFVDLGDKGSLGAELIRSSLQIAYEARADGDLVTARLFGETAQKLLQQLRTPEHHPLVRETDALSHVLEAEIARRTRHDLAEAIRELRHEVKALEDQPLSTAARLMASDLKQKIEDLRSKFAELHPRAASLIDDVEQSIEEFLDRLDREHAARREKLRYAAMRTRVRALHERTADAGRTWLASAAALMLTEHEPPAELWEEHSRRLIEDEGLWLAELARIESARPDDATERLWAYAVARVPSLAPLAALAVFEARTASPSSPHQHASATAELQSLYGVFTLLPPEVLCTPLFPELCRLVVERIRHTLRWAEQLPHTPAMLEDLVERFFADLWPTLGRAGVTAIKPVIHFFEQLRTLCPNAELATHPIHHVLARLQSMEHLGQAATALREEQADEAAEHLRRFFEHPFRTAQQVALALELLACYRAAKDPTLVARVSCIGHSDWATGFDEEELLNLDFDSASRHIDEVLSLSVPPDPLTGQPPTRAVSRL